MTQKQDVTEEIIDEIIDNSFCSDIFNDKTDVEIIKLNTVLNIVKKHLEGGLIMTKDEAIKYSKEQLDVFGGKHAEFVIELLEQGTIGERLAEKELENK